MKVNTGTWDTLTKGVVFLLFITGLAGVFCWYLPLFRQNQNFREKILRMDQEIAAQQLTNRILREAILAVQNDPLTVERMARERLGYSRPDEVVVKFEPPRASPSPTRVPSAPPAVDGPASPSLSTP